MNENKIVLEDVSCCVIMYKRVAVEEVKEDTTVIMIHDDIQQYHT